ncbi:MAG: mismatch-specific DNA-glycosylase [Firmicutes bacterium]|nr:mismatch-specific DNA-glycosylase [Alicyclobacillaceae bacterium]MCL6496199.1 mismatch-specific DNA-glycosylase [Bacillota bacterium]
MTEGKAVPPVPDLIRPGLRLLFVGYNPGQRSGAIGHHFAGRGNHFWRLLFEAGLTPVLLTAEQDQRLLEWGIGIVNLVDRVTPGIGELSREEMAAGGQRLRQRLTELCPRVTAFLGKNLWRATAELPAGRPVAWGWQPALAGTTVFVAPNPSGRSTLPYAERLEWFRVLAEAVVGSH